MPISNQSTAVDPKVLAIGESDFVWGARTYVMGIVNLTPDSFSGDGVMRTGNDWMNDAIDQAVRMEDEGADIIDVGGESTRPKSVYRDAEPVSAEEEIERVAPVVSALKQRLGIPVSIDTRKSEVADVALSLGAEMANDVSMLGDALMARTIAKHGKPVVISHTRKHAVYADVARDVASDLHGAVGIALAAGVEKHQIILDPGIGFAKNTSHNLGVLRELPRIKSDLDHMPFLVGASRKSFLGSVLGTNPQQRVEGNAAANAIAIANGADIIRVHEVREMVKVAKVVDAIVRGQEHPV